MCGQTTSVTIEHVLETLTSHKGSDYALYEPAELFKLCPFGFFKKFTDVIIKGHGVSFGQEN